MKRLAGLVAVVGLAMFSLAACGPGVPSPNHCTTSLYGPYSSFDAWGTSTTECVYDAEVIHAETQILFKTFWGWRTLQVISQTVLNTDRLSITPHWNCQGNAVHTYKISVTAYEIIGGVLYDQVPNPAETATKDLPCNPADGW